MRVWSFWLRVSEAFNPDWRADSEPSMPVRLVRSLATPWPMPCWLGSVVLTWLKSFVSSGS